MYRQTIRTHGGFTLLEITFVLLIASVVLSMTFISFSTLSQRAAARGAAQTFSSDLRQARAISSRTRAGVTMHFEEDSALYRVVSDGGDTLSIRFFDSRGEFRIDSLDLDLRGDTVRFEGTGAVDFAGLRISVADAYFWSGGREYRVRFNSTEPILTRYLT